MKKNIRWSLFLFLSIFAGFAKAEGFYVGFAVGQSDSDLSPQDEAGEVYELGNSIGVPVSSQFDNKDNTFNVYLGFDVSDAFAVEGGYVNFGSVAHGFASMFDPQSSIGNVSASTQFRIDVEGPHVSGLAKYSITDSANVYGRLGVLLWDTESLYRRNQFINGNSSGGDVTMTKNGTGIILGFGLDVHFLRVAYEIYKVDEFDVRFLNVGLKYEFD